MPATKDQIAAAIAAHGAARVHGAAYKAMQGGAARQALALVGLPTDGTIGDLDRIGKAAFAVMSPNDKAADLMGATVRAAMLPPVDKAKPGRKPLPQGAGKTARVQLKLTKADKAAWLRKAEAAGLTLQAWVEQRCKR
jgi:hypothetical protein